MILNKSVETFVIYIIICLKLIIIYLTQKILIAFSFIKKVIILAKYLDFANIISKKKF